MKAGRGCCVLMLASFVGGAGCTALREIPRSEYADRVGKGVVQVVTRDSTTYELESARIEADTLLGYRQRDVEGPIDEFDTVRLPLDDVNSISTRRIDWYRTGLIGGVVVAAIVLAAVRPGSKPAASTGGSGPREPQ